MHLKIKRAYAPMCQNIIAAITTLILFRSLLATFTKKLCSKELAEDYT
jgi:hypothetical protein